VTTLYNLAQVLRSKNAGPFLLTIDALFSLEEDYHLVANSKALDKGQIAKIYGVSEDAVRVFLFPLARAIKVVVPRAVSSGGVGDRDVYGAQQHGPLAGLEI